MKSIRRLKRATLHTNLVMFVIITSVYDRTYKQLVWLQVSGSGSGSGSNPLWFLLQIEALKLFSQEDLVSWFLAHRNNSRKLSVHVSV